MIHGLMVTVAQLVEPWTVTPVVVGSNPISHPISRIDLADCSNIELELGKTCS